MIKGLKFNLLTLGVMSGDSLFCMKRFDGINLVSLKPLADEVPVSFEERCKNRQKYPVSSMCLVRCFFYTLFNFETC